MVYTYKLPLRVGKNVLYTDLEFTRGDNVLLWLKFYDDAGNCLSAEGDILVAGYNNGLLFQNEVAALENEDGYYEIPLNLNTVALMDSTVRRATIIVRFSYGDKLRTISFDADIKKKILTGDEPDPELLPQYPAPEDLLKLQSPDGKTWQIRVSNDGNLFAELMA